MRGDVPHGPGLQTQGGGRYWDASFRFSREPTCVYRVAEQNSEVKALMASAGILDSAITALERWPNDADTAHASLCAICALTLGTPTTLAAPSDGFRLADALNDCMIYHADNSEITALSCRAKGNLARISTEVRDYLEDLGGASLLPE